MQQQYFNQIKELLLKLKNNQGHFIVQDGYFDTERNTGSEVFCQFAKNDKKDPITFEALSHYFDKSINKKLANRFFKLGFILEEESNYSKNIYLNSDTDINSTATEIVKIFEEFYNVNDQSDYDFDDQIEIVDNKSIITQNASYNNTNNTNKKKTKISSKGWILIILTVIFCYYAFFDKNDTHSTSNSKNEFMYVIKEEAYATANKSDFDDMYTYVVQNDTKALQSMIGDGLITILQPGTDVYVVDANIGYMVIRVSGSTQKLWVASERVSKK